MRTLFSRYRAFFMANVGHCVRCMRQSLAAALAVWGVFGIGLLIRPDGLVTNLIAPAAVGLTALWMLHVAAYAARAVAGAWGGDARPASGATGTVLAPTDFSVDHLGRRRALGVLLGAAGLGVLASVPVLLWPSRGLAFCGQCTKDEDCGVGYVCRNTAPVNSGEVCNECVAE